VRKRIHGKQSVPANILFSPVRAKKLPTLVPVVLRRTNTAAFHLAGSLSKLRANKQSPHRISCVTFIHEGTSHSRTLYTSKALDQSNFII